MLAKRIIPCLDIKNGTTVKGVRFEKLREAGDPVALAKLYSEQGADELVFLDISATEERRKTLAALVQRIAENINIPFTVGGGIVGLRDAEALLDAGADKISINSAAVFRPELVNELALAYGSQFVVAAVDARWEDNIWRVYTSGGKKQSDKELFSWVKQLESLGAGEILFTSMSHDGVQNGFAVDALAKLNEDLSIPLIASGGAGSMEHFADVFNMANVDAALAAGVFHFGNITIPNLKNYLKSKNIQVR